MPKRSHLTLQDRGTICARINQGIPFAQIAEELEKAPSTISREVRLHRVSLETGSYGRGFNACKNRMTCKKTHVCSTCYNGGKRCCFCKECNANCSDFVEQKCSKLEKPPYVCSGCKNKQRCTLRKYEYQPNLADQSYRETLSESRKGQSTRWNWSASIKSSHRLSRMDNLSTMSL